MDAIKEGIDDAMADESSRDISAPTIEMVTRYISADQFLEPWNSQLQRVCEASGVESYQVSVDSRLYKAAVKLIKIAYGPDDPSGAARDEALRDIDWLLQLLAPETAEGEAQTALLPDGFWSTLAGRTLYQALELALGEEFCDLETAANRLGVPKARIYHLVATRSVPAYLGEDNGHGRRKYRVRMDQLEKVLSDGDEGAGKGSTSV